jgi:hypothetical protein
LPNALGGQADPATDFGQAHQLFVHAVNDDTDRCARERICGSLFLAVSLETPQGLLRVRHRAGRVSGI